MSLDHRQARIIDVTCIVEVTDLENLDSAFGTVGLRVGPRTGPNRRTQDDKEWYVVRRFLKEALFVGYFSVPVRIQKGMPPDPDFLMTHGGVLASIEITEATDEADQKEMTTFAELGKSALLGTYGGRFAKGANGRAPEIAWTSDTVAAIRRKSGKAIFFTSNDPRHLVIYPNSNASSLLLDAEDETEAFRILQTNVASNMNQLSQITNGCHIHILGKEYAFLDIMKTPRIIRRQFKK